MQGTLATPSLAMAALAFVVALVLLAGRLLRSTSFSRARPSNSLSSEPKLAVLDTLPLDRARRLHVVQWQDRTVLLMTGGPNDQVIGWVPDEGIAQ